MEREERGERITREKKSQKEINESLPRMMGCVSFSFCIFVTDDSIHQSMNPVLTILSKKNLRSASSVSLIPSAFKRVKSPVSTAINTFRKCSKSLRIKWRAAPKSSRVSLSVWNIHLSFFRHFFIFRYFEARWNRKGTEQGLMIVPKGIMIVPKGIMMCNRSTDLRVQQLLCELLQEAPGHHELWFQTIFPGNLLHDSPEEFEGNSLSLQPEVVLLYLTTRIC